MRKLLFALTLLAGAAQADIISEVVKGETDVSVEVKIIDLTTGAPETGVVFNTSGIDLWYRRQGAASVDITEADLATPALTDAHADGGFLHINDGVYRLDLPDAATAAGADYVYVGGTVTDMIVIGGRVQLSDIDPNTALETKEAIADAVRGEPCGTEAADTLGDYICNGGPWNADWDAEVQSEVADGLNAYDPPTNTEMNAQFADVDNALAVAEPVGVPAFTADVGDVLSWLLALSRNEINQTSTTKTLRNDADDGDIATCAVSDNGTTFTRAECQ